MKASTGLQDRKIPKVNGKLLMGIARVIDPLGGRKVGIHSDRVKKLIVSTNISGKKLKNMDYSFHYTIGREF